MIRRFRRFIQVVFFIAFITLILLTEGRYDAGLDAFNIRYPVSIMFKFDPLILSAAVFSTWQIPAGFIFSVGLLAFTLIFGRFFCGWICPMGSCIDFVERRFFRKGMIRKKPLSFTYRHLKFILLLFILVSAILGVGLVGHFDPLVMITRFFITVIIPAILAILNMIFGVINSILNFMSDSNIMPAKVHVAKDIYNSFLFNFENNIFSLDLVSYSTSLFVLVITVVVFSLSFFGCRTWCKNICPLGALLGICSSFSLIRRKVRQNCDECAICLTHCHGAVKNQVAINSYEPKECIRCFECVNTCRRQKAFFGLALPQVAKSSSFLPSRRQFIATIFGGILFSGYAQSAKWLPKSKVLIRPPGSSPENDFMKLCVRCGQCMKVCPTKVIQPCFLEGGLSGFWAPRLNYQAGYCDDVCTRCGQVCPTGAIKYLSKFERKFSKIGTAFFNKDRCLPWYKNENCIKCEEHCPVASKAIRYEEVTVTGEYKEKKIVKRPFVNETACIGCGICEYKCPVSGSPGIEVTNYKEKRY